MQPPLILLHGALGSEQQFDQVRQRFTGHGPIHTFNFEGHGGLPINSPLTMARLADQLLAYIEINELDRPDVFGYSMGGYVALHCAHQHHTSIGRIITLGTKMKWDPDIAANETKKLNPEVIEQKVPAFAESLKNRHAPADWKENMQATAQLMISLGNGQALTESDLHHITNTVYLCLGDQDQMVTAEETQWAAAQMPNAQFRLVRGWKHPIETIDPSELANLLHTLLATA